jgi:penicillin amidase
MRRRLLRSLLLLGLALVAGAAGVLWTRAQLRASLPLLEGTHRLSGLAAPVTVTRDHLGIPTIRGGSREDVARATGFLHAQDRFFQMDLTRRRAAGELSALLGGRALEADRDIRRHRFRDEAQRALALMTPRERALLAAYTAGVNSGLGALGTKPFEYLLLRQAPQPWREEDCLLVVLSMFITLQDDKGAYESSLGTIHDVLPKEMAAFLTSPGTEWDTPVVGPAFAVPAIPGPEVYNLRARRTGKPPVELALRDGMGDGAAIGSNNWVVAGRLTPDGGALVANDMHLGVRVPNTWYRAMLEWTDTSSFASASVDETSPRTPDRRTVAPSHPRTLIGVTLPGVPALVVGSNTHVAWGFTNTYADWGDLVLLDVDPQNPGRYRTPDGWRNFEQHREVIAVAGAPDDQLDVRWTIWGPVVGTDHRGRQRAFRWVAHSAEQLAGKGVTPFESAQTLEDAFADANGRGTPGQNMVVADRSGRIGWTVYGSIPRRVGLDGARPSSWADGSRGWSGWLDTTEYPRIVDPPDGRIWTANARVVDGAMLAQLGDNSYEVGSRARIIRDRLMAATQFTPRDMLRIQLDTRAAFLARWRDLILRTLTPQAASTPDRAELRDIVDRGWTGEASPDSAAYGLTRRFRDEVSRRVMTFIHSECYEADPEFDHTTNRRREGPTWKLIAEQPMHLLDPAFASWNELLLASIDSVIADALTRGDLQYRVWAEYNPTTYRHPLSASLPFVGRLLDMRQQQLPGDLYTPRVASFSVAASERMVVSPGREADGIMQMPTGQSGHPLSPFYRNSHDAWVRGDPTPFLPGPPMHHLTLTP